MKKRITAVILATVLAIGLAASACAEFRPVPSDVGGGSGSINENTEGNRYDEFYPVAADVFVGAINDMFSYMKNSMDCGGADIR